MGLSSYNEFRHIAIELKREGKFNTSYNFATTIDKEEENIKFFTRLFKENVNFDSLMSLTKFTDRMTSDDKKVEKEVLDNMIKLCKDVYKENFEGAYMVAEPLKSAAISLAMLYKEMKYGFYGLRNLQYIKDSLQD